MTTANMRRGWDAANEEAEAAKAAFKNNAFDWYLKPDTEGDLIFLDDDPIVSRLHTMRTGPKQFFKFLCLGEDCPGCEAEDRPSLVGFFTVLRLTHLPSTDNPDWKNEDDWDMLDNVDKEIRTKNGELIKNPVQLLIAKLGTLEILKRHNQKRDGLVGARYNVARTSSDKAPNVGDVWEFDKKYDPEQIAILNPEAEPLDYDEALPIFNADEIRRRLGGAARGDDEPAPRRPASKTVDEDAEEAEERPARTRANAGKSKGSERRLNW